ncbi:sulfite exporter TauE/SafE family protein, partial [Psychrobacter sp. FME6]|nr:sulfite exporter TauE/SafE family protein [Psychrobacter sp. FME6]
VLMFAFGLGTIPMLVATHGTVNWIRHHIGRLRLRQLNGAIMVISGLAVVAVPMVMANMHGHMDHGHMDHGHMDHGHMDHGQMNHEQMNHEQMNHEQMNHEQMNHEQMNHEQMNHEH